MTDIDNSEPVYEPTEEDLEFIEKIEAEE